MEDYAGGAGGAETKSDAGIADRIGHCDRDRGGDRYDGDRKRQEQEFNELVAMLKKEIMPP